MNASSGPGLPQGYVVAGTFPGGPTTYANRKPMSLLEWLRSGRPNLFYFQVETECIDF